MQGRRGAPAGFRDALAQNLQSLTTVQLQQF
jgi:hypothetical protein